MSKRFNATDVCVWAVWALMLVGTVGLVWQYGSNVPSWDGWDMVPALTGAQPVTLSWLWSQHSEHRVPLPRLILLALNKATVLDFRVGMYFDVVVLALVAAALILVARRLRGATSYTDIFFPLILLDWGQAQNMLWDWQVSFIASAVLSSLVLLVIVQTGVQISLEKAGFLSGICVLMLPLTGANGVALVPALAIWLGYLGIVLWRTNERAKRYHGLFIISLAFGGLLLVVLYFVGYESVPWHRRSPGLIASVKTFFFFYMSGFGPANRSLPWLSALVTLALLLLTALVLAYVLRAQPQERPRAFGLMMFLVAMMSLATGIALGRKDFELRYGTLVIPAWCCVYYVFSLYSSAKINLSARALLVFVLVVSEWANTQFGIAYARDLREHLEAFERDLTTGVPSYKLIRHHQPYLHINQDLLHDYLPLLRDAGVGKFRWLRSNPPFRELSFPLVPSELYLVRWEDDTIYAEGRPDQWPHIVFPLRNGRYIAGLRLKYSYWNKDGTSPCRIVRWKRPGQNTWPNEQSSKHCPTGDHANWFRGSWVKLTDPEATSTVWVDDVIKEIMITPDGNPGRLHLSELMLLVPIGN